MFMSGWCSWCRSGECQSDYMRFLLGMNKILNAEFSPQQFMYYLCDDFRKLVMLMIPGMRCTVVLVQKA